MEQIKWWAYRHTDGSIQVLRYTGPQDLAEARGSSFVVECIGAFPAASRTIAVKIAEARFE